MEADIAKINKMPDYLQKFLYGECDKWCVQNFKPGFEIVAIMVENSHEDGIVHAYLRKSDTRQCYDIRGEMENDEVIIRYTGIDYYEDNIEEFVFYTIEEFERYLKWVDFERVKTQYLV